ncbi:MAG: hypothetical protein WBM67_02735 [Sedimenticolaceae bacterium]
MAIQLYRCLSTWFCLTLALPVHADEAAAGMSELMQLNRSSQQQLKTIQDSPGRVDAAQREPGADQLDRQQVVEQQMLQERQRRELLMQNQRARTGADTGLPPGPQSIQQQQFRRQQQNQLNRFRIQQGSRYR